MSDHHKSLLILTTNGFQTFTFFPSFMAGLNFHCPTAHSPASLIFFGIFTLALSTIILTFKVAERRVRIRKKRRRIPVSFILVLGPFIFRSFPLSGFGLIFFSYISTIYPDFPLNEIYYRKTYGFISLFTRVCYLIWQLDFVCFS